MLCFVPKRALSGIMADHIEWAWTSWSCEEKASLQ